jgi:hypothetical protein
MQLYQQRRYIGHLQMRKTTYNWYFDLDAKAAFDKVVHSHLFRRIYQAVKDFGYFEC